MTFKYSLPRTYLRKNQRTMFTPTVSKMERMIEVAIKGKQYCLTSVTAQATIKFMETKVIGLTGNIATGKSTILNLAAEQGAEVIDADKLVHELLANNEKIQADIVSLFGDTVTSEHGINRAALGQIVFNDPDKLKQLENILHPAVREETVRRLEASTAPVVMVEAIKLLDGPLAESADEIWVTACSRETQLERLQTYRNYSREEAISRIDAQSPQADKIARADVVFDTNGSMAETKADFKKAWATSTQTNLKHDTIMASEETSMNWFAKHPNLTAWFVLAAGMVAILIFEARKVGLETSQWFWLIFITILVAGLCIWIINWGDDDELDEAEW